MKLLNTSKKLHFVQATGTGLSHNLPLLLHVAVLVTAMFDKCIKQQPNAVHTLMMHVLTVM